MFSTCVLTFKKMTEISTVYLLFGVLPREAETLMLLSSHPELYSVSKNDPNSYKKKKIEKEFMVV